MSEPRRPRTVVGDPAEIRNQLHGTLDVAARDAGFRLVKHRLVEPGTSAPRLIDDVGRNAFADEVRVPPLAAIRRRLESRAGVGGPVHHDDGPAGADLFAGIWNCTYICPMVICWGAGAAAAPPGAANGAAACSEIFATPPMKKLPWSSRTSCPPMNRFGDG